MGKTNLKFIFHNPNTKEDTINYLTKILIETGKKKLDKVLKEESERQLESIEGHNA